MERPFPAYKGDEPYIFVSYAHEDTELVYPEIQWLHDHGFNVWYDEGISPGSRWSEELATFLENSSLFLYFGTPHSVNSTHCLDEINFALDGAKPTIAVHLRQTELTPGLQLRLSSHQAILKYELSDQEYRDKLVAGINDHVRQTGVGPEASAVTSVSSGDNKSVIIGFGLVALAILIVGILLVFRFPGPSGPAAITERAPGEDQPASAPSEEKPSIAVLPFDNVSPLEENAYFAAGIHEDILSSLSKIRALKVISRTSVLRFADSKLSLPEIASQLGAVHILEGSVRRVGNRVRITVQLIDARNDAHLWSETYDRDLADIFAMQSEVAQRITEQLKVALDVGTLSQIKAGPTQNMEAYDLYMRGRELVRTGSSAGVEAAMSLFQQALDIDHEFALAHAAIAQAYSIQAGINVEWREVRDRAFAAARRGLELDPNDSDVQLTMGAMHNLDRNYLGAARFMQKAIELNPNNEDALGTYGALLYGSGRPQEAFIYWRRSYDLDPLSPIANSAMALILRTLGRIDEAKNYVDRRLELQPNALSHSWASLFYWNLGDHYRQVYYLKRAHELDPEDISYPLNLSDALLWLGDAQSAEKWLDIATQIAPNHELLFRVRADLLTAEQRVVELAELVDKWNVHNPDSHQGRRFRARPLIFAADKAWDEERFDESRRLREEAMQHLDAYLDPDRIDGVIQLRQDNVWGALSYALNAKILGYEDIWKPVCKMIVKFYESEQTLFFAHFHLSVMHALLDNIPRALDHFEQVPDTTFNAIWIINPERAAEDRYDILNGLGTNIAFKNTVEKIRLSNEETLSRIHQDMPELIFAAAGTD